MISPQFLNPILQMAIVGTTASSQPDLLSNSPWLPTLNSVIMANNTESESNEAQQDGVPAVEAQTDAAATDASAADEAPANNKRKFDEEGASPQAAGDERQFKRAVVEPDSVLAAGSAQVMVLLTLRYLCSRCVFFGWNQVFECLFGVGR